MKVTEKTDRHFDNSKADKHPFDPISLSEATEKAVCRGDKRKYFHFGTTLDYITGVATGYAVGCNLRCVFCWANDTRDDTKK
ncbi:hypothetical protein ACFL03_12150, partial [Thermodesulfobacteriota bacterium]